jgi:segregation and condensation protein B
MSESTLADDLEAILFAAGEPMSAKRLGEALASSPEAIDQALTAIERRLTHGVRLARTGGTYRLVTAPESAATVRKFLNDSSSQELTRPALETLAIIAYRGPITKSGVEQIRGVASETMLRGLLSRGLITEAGKSREPGHPKQYEVTHAFLAHFGLTSSNDLPPLPEAAHEN